MTEKVRRQPYCVLLFDEIEKANPETINLFLQILDDGLLTDAEGQVINFENTLIVFTSNIGSEHIVSQRRALGLSSESHELSDSEIEALVRDELKKSFKPEFLNRLDETIIFRKLSHAAIEQILEINLTNLGERLWKQGLRLEVTSEAKAWLCERGFDPLYGARPLRRLLEKEIENKVARELVRSGRTKADRALAGESRLSVAVDPQDSQQLKITAC